MARETFGNPCGNRRHGAEIGHQTGRSQAKNAQGRAHKQAQTNCDRFRTGLGLLRPRSENCKLRNSSGEQPMQNVQLLKLCGSLLGRAGQSKPMKVEQAVGESALSQPTRNEGANGLMPCGEEWLKLQGCPRRPMRLLIKKPYPMLRRSAFGPDIGLPSRISVGF